jgi:hypothetical protein
MQNPVLVRAGPGSGKRLPPSGHDALPIVGMDRVQPAPAPVGVRSLAAEGFPAPALDDRAVFRRTPDDGCAGLDQCTVTLLAVHEGRLGLLPIINIRVSPVPSLDPPLAVAERASAAQDPPIHPRMVAKPIFYLVVLAGREGILPSG